MPLTGFGQLTNGEDPPAVICDAEPAPMTTTLWPGREGDDANRFRGRIVRRADSGEVSTLATDQAEAISIAVDDRAVFWTVDTEHGLPSLQR